MGNYIVRAIINNYNSEYQKQQLKYKNKIQRFHSYDNIIMNNTSIINNNNNKNNNNNNISQINLT